MGFVLIAPTIASVTNAQPQEAFAQKQQNASDFQTGFQAGEKDGANAVGDIGDTCNDAKNQTACFQGYKIGFNLECKVGQKLFPTADIQCPWKPFAGSVNEHTFKAPPPVKLTQ